MRRLLDWKYMQLLSFQGYPVSFMVLPPLVDKITQALGRNSCIVGIFVDLQIHSLLFTHRTKFDRLVLIPRKWPIDLIFRTLWSALCTLRGVNDRTYCTHVPQCIATQLWNSLDTISLYHLVINIIPSHYLTPTVFLMQMAIFCSRSMKRVCEESANITKFIKLFRGELLMQIVCSLDLT